MTDIETECIRRIAGAKAIPADSIGLDTDLASIAVDSLDRVSLSFDLEEQYGIEIPESRLQQIHTIRDVADAVQDALRDKQVKSATPSGKA